MKNPKQIEFEQAMHELEQAALEAGFLTAERARRESEDRVKQAANVQRYNRARCLLVALAGFPDQPGLAT